MDRQKIIKHFHKILTSRQRANELYLPSTLSFRANRSNVPCRKQRADSYICVIHVATDVWSSWQEIMLMGDSSGALSNLQEAGSKIYKNSINQPCFWEASCRFFTSSVKVSQLFISILRFTSSLLFLRNFNE